MKGNDEFRKSQRAADKKSKEIAEKIMAESPIARAYYETIPERVSPDRDRPFPFRSSSRANCRCPG